MGRPGNPADTGAADRVTGVAYDSGALIAAERGERRMWARHRALLLRRVVPVVPAPVVAQSWRGISPQAQLSRLLAGCRIEPPHAPGARAPGSLARPAATPLTAAPRVRA